MIRRENRRIASMAATAAAIALVFAAASARTSWASDHQDDETLIADPAADIADVFAFMRPDGPDKLVLVMTLNPGATAGTTFDPGIDYQFRVLGYDVAGALDPTVDTHVSCRFQPKNATGQVMLCDANGHSIAGAVGTATDPDAGASMRAWAGLRADPAFGDVAAVKSTLAARQLKLTDAGTNAFEGKNILAIVVEVDVDHVLFAGIDASASRPLLAVSATTERL